MSDDGRGTAIQRLRRLDACAASDALDRLGLEGALGGFRRWGGGGVVAGTVITVAVEPGPGPAAGSHLGTRALSAAGPDDVIVVANQARTEAGAWGGLLTLQARGRGVAGVIVDGALRDADEVELLEVPLFARATTPRTARGRFHEAATGVTVRVGGMRVDPGGLVVADGSGIVFLPAEEVGRVLPVAEEIARKEARMSEALRGGGPGSDVLGPDYERMLDG